MKIGPKSYGDRPATASPSSSGKGHGGAIGGPVSEQYFGMPISDTQSADEPWDKASKGNKADDGVFKTGRGSQGGGSKMTPQIKRMVTGSGTRGRSKTTTPASYPKQTQRIRGR